MSSLALLVALRYSLAAAEMLQKLSSGDEITKEMLDDADRRIKEAINEWKDAQPPD